MKFSDIKPYTKDGNYRTHHPLKYLKSTIETYIEVGLQLNQTFSAVMYGLKNSKLNLLNIY